MCVMVPVCFVVEHVACMPVVLRGVSVCLCLLVCAMRAVVWVPGCVCIGGCLCIFVLCYVPGLWLCEYLSDGACVWQHVGLWTGLA